MNTENKKSALATCEDTTTKNIIADKNENCKSEFPVPVAYERFCELQEAKIKLDMISRLIYAEIGTAEKENKNYAFADCYKLKEILEA